MDKPIENEATTTFDVYDIGMAAALLSLGHELIAMHILECGVHVVFHYEPTTLVEKDAEAYKNDKLSVNAKHFHKAYEYIDDYLYGELNHED